MGKFMSSSFSQPQSHERFIIIYEEAWLQGPAKLDDNCRMQQIGIGPSVASQKLVWVSSLFLDYHTHAFA